MYSLWHSFVAFVASQGRVFVCHLGDGAVRVVLFSLFALYHNARSVFASTDCPDLVPDTRPNCDL